jgi:hypothetical protein
MFFLSSHTTPTHPLASQDGHRDLSDPQNTTSMAFLVKTTSEDRQNIYVNFLDVVLKSSAVGESSMTLSCTPGLDVVEFDEFIFGVQRGCARFIAVDDPWSEDFGVYTVNSDRTIVATDLPIGDFYSMEGDVLTGRVCVLETLTSVQIFDYV